MSILESIFYVTGGLTLILVILCIFSYLFSYFLNKIVDTYKFKLVYLAMVLSGRTNYLNKVFKDNDGNKYKIVKLEHSIEGEK